jgi:hypothetical protein
MKKHIVLLLCSLLIIVSGCSHYENESTPIDTSASVFSNTTTTQEGDTKMSSSMQNTTTTQGKEEITSSKNAENNQSKKTAEILNLDSNKGYSELIKSYYPAEMLKDITFAESDNFNTMIDWLNNKYPIECIRVQAYAMNYVIYQLHTGERVIVFFHGDTLQFANWCFVIDKLLTKNNFSSIKKGSNLNEVETIDAGFKLYNQIKSNNLDWSNIGISLHIVKEGFMKIEYQESLDGNFDKDAILVKSINFFPNGSEILGQTFNLLQVDFV